MIAQEQKPDSKPLQQWRCAQCNTRLADYQLAKGSKVVIKCYRCGHFNCLQVA